MEESRTIGFTGNWKPLHKTPQLWPMENYAPIKCQTWHSQDTHTQTQSYSQSLSETPSRHCVPVHPVWFFDLSYISAQSPTPINNIMAGWCLEGGDRRVQDKEGGEEGVTQKHCDRNALWVISNTHKRWLIWAPVDSHIYLYSIIQGGPSNKRGPHIGFIWLDSIWTYVCVCVRVLGKKDAPHVQSAVSVIVTTQILQ